MPSETVKKIIGTYIQDSKPGTPVPAWLQDELRSGNLAQAVREFAEKQQEDLDPLLVQVERVTESVIYCRIPWSGYDRESRSPFRYDVEFELNPLTGGTLRRN
jgi:hypothetical protein